MPPAEPSTFLQTFTQALDRMGIRRNQDVVLFVNSLTGLEAIDCPPYRIVDTLLDAVGQGGTVVMQTFNWQFCNGRPYHARRTPSATGLVSEVFRRMDGVIRSPHPIYSFCASGPLAKDICRHPADTCWGLDTPMGALVRENALCINLVKPFPWGISLLHHFEEVRMVPYRYFKTFNGQADFGDGPLDYATRFYVRDLELDLEYNWQPAVDVVMERGQVAESDGSLPMTAIRAQDLSQACNACMDKDINIFLGKGHPSFQKGRSRGRQ